MPGMKEKKMRMMYAEGEKVMPNKNKRKPMNMGSRYGMVDGGLMVKAAMKTQKPN
tara:strand:- start:511 stop:675 length:165 start_codon:yes stop_codon:yes gene_type:complete